MSGYILKLWVPVGLGVIYWVFLNLVRIERNEQKREYTLKRMANHFWYYKIENRIFVITGITTRLGFEITRALVLRHATVILACRDMGKAQKAIESIRKETENGQMIPIELDLTSPDSVKAFTKIYTVDKYYYFDWLVKDAELPIWSEQYKKEGLQIHFGMNNYKHFNLLTMLSNVVIQMDKARVVLVSSQQTSEENEYVSPHTYEIDVQEAFREREVNKHYDIPKLEYFYVAKMQEGRGFDIHVLSPGLFHTNFFRSFNPKWYHYVLFAPFAPIFSLFNEMTRQEAQDIAYCATLCFDKDTYSFEPSYPVFITILPS